MFKFFTYCFLLGAGSSGYNCYTTEEANASTDLGKFNSWRHKYNKTYNGIWNISKYYRTWQKNRDLVERHNRRTSTFSMEVNMLADQDPLTMTDEATYNSHLAAREFKVPYEIAERGDLPTKVDWRTKGIVSPVKNQGQCGSCWAFSATGSMEGQHALAKGKLISFSESQIVDCDGVAAGCGGGFMDSAFEYVISTGGIESEAAYPYLPENKKCVFNTSRVAAHFKGYQDVKGGEAGLKEAVAYVGPVSVAIDASEPGFQLYEAGVYYGPSCSTTLLDHGVLVVGYGTTLNGTDYWIVKNSWGSAWGDNGYILMSRNRNNNCGIATQPSYPTV